MPSGKDRPNIILLTIDTLRADRVGCYGHKGQLTPNLDRLAASGIRFDQAITGGSWTQAAFPVILTSTYASYFGGCLGALASERPSPIQVLEESGYSTAAFITSPLLGRNYGYHRGFRHFSELVPKRSDPALRGVKGGERLLRKSITHTLANLLGQDLRPAQLYVTAPELTDAVCDWLETSAAPFFVWAHYMDVHWPYHLEESIKGADEIARVWRDLAFLNRVNRAGEVMYEEQKAFYVQLYDQAVQYTDFHLGRLFNQLENSGLMENTIIVVVSDHGEEFLERRHWGHFEVNLYDEIIRVPLILYSPADRAEIESTSPGGCVVHQQVRLLDIMPTLLALCHCAPPAGMEGASLIPTWRVGEGNYAHPTAISEMWRDHRHKVAVRTNQYKYIWDSMYPDAAEIYDLVIDTQERQNIINENKPVAEKFHKLVLDFIQRAEQSANEVTITPVQLDESPVQRLRDLGYID